MPHWKSQTQVSIDEIARGLHRISGTNRTPTGIESHFHSYFLVGPAATGNLLFHGPDRVPFYKQYADYFDRHGGIQQQVLTHGGDASKSTTFVQDQWGAPVRVNRAELDEVTRAMGRTIDEGFEGSFELAPGIEAIHLPSHAVGFTVFRCTIEGKRYLISGHIGKQFRNEWRIGLHPLMAETAVRSLKTLERLDCDFLLPDYTVRDPAPPIPFGESERSAMVASVLAHVARKYGVAID